MNHPQVKSASLQFPAMLRLLAYIFVWAIFSGQLEAAYKYPIGIPKAWIDPDVERPARPDQWTTEVPGYYFVDHVNGTDSGRTWGRPGAPRKTIPNPLGPGTYCEVLGTYTTGNTWTTLNGNGSVGDWVANTTGPAWVVGLDADNRASFGDNLFLKGQYLCCEYLDNLAGNKIVQFSSASTGYEAKFMLFRHSEIKGIVERATTAVAISCNSAQITNNIVVYHNKVHGFGPLTPPVYSPGITDYDKDANGISIADRCQRIWVLDNEIYEMSGAGTGCSTWPGGPSPTSYIYFGRNHLHDLWGVGIGIKTSDHVVISENLIHDIKYCFWTGAKCIGAQYALESLWVLFNHCYNGDMGIKVGSGSGPNEMNVYVIGNTVHDIYDPPAGINPNPPSRNGYYGAITLWSGTKRVVVGNTVVSCHNGIVFPGANENHPYSAVVENNIVADILANHLEVDLVTSASKWRNNLLFQKDRNVNIWFGARISVDQANALGYVSGLIVADPLFTDAPNKDFSIASGSRAEDAGLPDTGLTFDVYAAYLADFGVPINVDIAGRPRPAGAGWDIGAYEGSSSKPVTLLPPPSFIYKGKG